MKAFTIGVDYGTNSVRAVVIDCADGREVGAHVFNYPSGHNLARQNPADYVQGLEETVVGALTAAEASGEFKRDAVIGIGVDTTGSTPIPVNGDCVPLGMTEAFKDNVVLNYAGIKASELDASQQSGLLDLIGLYVGNMREGHAQVRMSEVEAHLDDTRFAWIGGTRDDAVFYYRIHSPVILIEFDHQSPIAMRQYFPNRLPNRQHIHAVVRTPNGNDYGKDLLRQHYEKHEH